LGPGTVQYKGQTSRIDKDQRTKLGNEEQRQAQKTKNSDEKNKEECDNKTRSVNTVTTRIRSEENKGCEQNKE